MRPPTVAVVGRPNVGKSTLVNRMVGSRKAIVDDLPGVTRDRAYYDAEWLNNRFTVIDTGGLALGGESPLFSDQVNEQVIVAIEEADAIIFVLDGLTGITAVDEEVARRLQRSRKPVIVAVNKIDTKDLMANTADFYALGLGNPYPVSAMHGTVGVGDMLDALIKLLQDEAGLDFENPEERDEAIHVAFVGRPNVGKSSIVNKLLGEERTIVSDVAGTTRDSIDTEVSRGDARYILVDTAGIRRRSKVEYGVEMFSVDRSIRAMKRADVTVLIIDAQEGLTDQDKRLIETSNEAGRGLLIVVNKWDLVEDKKTNTVKEFERKLYVEAPHAIFAPMVFTSALTGQRVEKIFEWVDKITENHRRRIKTSVVNQLLLEAYTLAPPAPYKNKRLKIYYGTQVDIQPPTFLLFVNSDKLMQQTYKRYLEKRLRENIELTGVPIRLFCRSKDEKDTKV